MIRDCDCDAECGLDECHFIEIARRVWAPTKSRNEEEKKKNGEKTGLRNRFGVLLAIGETEKQRPMRERERKKMQEKK